MIIITGLFGVYVYFNSALLKINPFEKTFKFSNPYIVAKDSKNNFILLDNKSKRLTKIDPKGKVIFSLEGGKRDKGSFYVSQTFCLDDNDNIYIQNVIVNMEDSYPGTYQILKFTPDGKYDKTLYNYERSREERRSKDAMLFGNLQVIGDSVYYVLIKMDEKKETYSTIYKVSVNGGSPEKVVAIPGWQSFLNFTGSEAGNMYLTKLDGKIYRIEANGNLTPVILASSSAIEAPWGLAINKNKVMFISDIASQSFFKILPNKTIESFIVRLRRTNQGNVV